MKFNKVFLGAVAATLMLPSVSAQAAFSIEVDVLGGGGVFVEDGSGDTLYGGLRAIDLTVSVNGDPKVERAIGGVVLSSFNGPVVSCRTEEVDIDCDGISTLNCADAGVVEIDAVNNTLDVDGTLYELENGNIVCREISPGTP